MQLFNNLRSRQWSRQVLNQSTSSRYVFAEKWNWEQLNSETRGEVYSADASSVNTFLFLARRYWHLNCIVSNSTACIYFLKLCCVLTICKFIITHRPTYPLVNYSYFSLYVIPISSHWEWPTVACFESLMSYDLHLRLSFLSPYKRSACVSMMESSCRLLAEIRSRRPETERFLFTKNCCNKKMPSLKYSILQQSIFVTLFSRTCSALKSLTPIIHATSCSEML